MSLQFTQEEVEGALAAAMPHGCRRDIARRSGLGESYIKRQFNPDDETPSCAFKLLQIACALDDIDSKLGDEFWETLSQFRELSKKRMTGKPRDLSASTGKFNQEVAEFVMKRLRNASIGEQIDELADVQRELEELMHGLQEEFNREHESRKLQAVK